MNTRFPFALALLAGALVLASPARAGQVYKCTVDGKTVYQDAPCREAFEPVHLRVNLGSGKVDRLTVGELQDEMRVLEERERKVSQGLARDMEHSYRTNGTAQDQDRVRAEYSREMKANEERRNAINAEMRRRCPGGGYIDGRSTPTCRQ